MTPAIEVRNLRRTFRVRGGLFGQDRRSSRVDDVSFALPTGGVLGVVGESGCGKSTLARRHPRPAAADARARCWSRASALATSTAGRAPG